MRIEGCIQGPDEPREALEQYAENIFALAKRAERDASSWRAQKARRKVVLEKPYLERYSSSCSWRSARSSSASSIALAVCLPIEGIQCE